MASRNVNIVQSFGTKSFKTMREDSIQTKVAAKILLYVRWE